VRKREFAGERVNDALRHWAQEFSDAPPFAGPKEARATGHGHTAAQCRPAGETQNDNKETRQDRSDARAGEAGERKEDCGADDHQRFETADLYEVLQISRNADAETIHRVYRIMAARFHPDNPKTGNTERFLLMKRAYYILSDPARRAEYDATYEITRSEPMPVFQLREFVDGVEGERNRRLGILSLLYNLRRRNDARPGISVLELERRMSIPREYLTFTLWYLRLKGYVSCEDSSDYAVTPEGVDYVEAHSSTNTVVRDLLNPGAQGEPEPSAS
jgi:curved DNA-binding protein